MSISRVLGAIRGLDLVLLVTGHLVMLTQLLFQLLSLLALGLHFLICDF